MSDLESDDVATPTRAAPAPPATLDPDPDRATGQIEATFVYEGALATRWGY